MNVLPITLHTFSSMSAARTMKICCLRDFAVWVDDQLIPPERWSSRKAGAIRTQRLLLFLARHRKPQPIKMIAQYVWPYNWNEINISKNFHLTLTQLRQVFESSLTESCKSQFVLTMPQGYCLSPDIDIIVDLDQFLMLVCMARKADASGNNKQARAAFVQAEQLYRRPFVLAKHDPCEAEEYDRTAREVLYWLATDDLHHGSIDACIRRLRRLLYSDPWDSRASTLLIEAYLVFGNRQAARRQYARHLKVHGDLSVSLRELAQINQL